MNVLMIVLRLIHIVSGVFWVGGGMIAALFLSPAVAATGEAGQKMMGYMVNTGRMSVRITYAAFATVLAGAILYWIDSDGLTSGWTSSPTGLGFALGAILAIIGLVYGMMVGQSVKKMGMIAAASKGQPTPEQLGEIQAAQRRMANSSRISTIALVLALACMATARYWGL